MRDMTPRQAARAAKLRHVSDETVAGITRHGAKGRFRYHDPSGKVIRDVRVLRRIAKLAIPPAWTHVWIAPFANAHLLATGRDARGRKQYRYHPGFAAMRDSGKYQHLLRFAQSLPSIRRRLKVDLRRPGLPREKILAAVVTLLEETLIRVGNEDYARSNGSFGLTTLHNRHVAVKGEKLTFIFKGKSGRKWDVSIHDPRIAKVMRACQELPGQHLFEYRDQDGGVHAVSSTDVNDYLREIAGEDVSAKDFRTWAGTVEAAIAFSHTEGLPSRKAAKDVIAGVAAQLGNTPAVCRKCYIHPAVIDGFQQQSLKLKVMRAGGGLSGKERSVLAWLRARPRWKQLGA